MLLDRLINMLESSDLSSVKGVIGRIIHLIHSPEASSKELKELILMDPPLTARVLRVANSPFYGAPCSISDVDHALVWIGFDALSEIVLTQKVVELFSVKDASPAFSVRSLWKHSLAVAVMAKTIFRREFGEPGHDAYAAGLIHDIGVLVECQLLPKEFDGVANAVDGGQMSLNDAETEILEFDHGAVGGLMAERWNFPPKLVTAISCHHSPFLATGENARLTRTLYVSDYLAFQHGFGYGKAAYPEKAVIQPCARRLGLTEYSMNTLATLMIQEMEHLERTGYL